MTSHGRHRGTHEVRAWLVAHRIIGQPADTARARAAKDFQTEGDDMTSVVVFDYGFGNVRSMVRALAQSRP